MPRVRRNGRRACRRHDGRGRKANAYKRESARSAVNTNCTEGKRADCASWTVNPVCGFGHPTRANAPSQ